MHRSVKLIGECDFYLLVISFPSHGYDTSQAPMGFKPKQAACKVDDKPTELSLPHISNFKWPIVHMNIFKWSLPLILNMYNVTVTFW